MLLIWFDLLNRDDYEEYDGGNHEKAYDCCAHIVDGIPSIVRHGKLLSDICLLEL